MELHDESSAADSSGTPALTAKRLFPDLGEHPVDGRRTGTKKALAQAVRQREVSMLSYAMNSVGHSTVTSSLLAAIIGCASSGSASAACSPVGAPKTPSHFATAADATALPSTLVTVRPMSRK